MPIRSPSTEADEAGRLGNFHALAPGRRGLGPEAQRLGRGHFGILEAQLV